MGMNMNIDPLSAGLGVLGGVGSYLTGRSAQNAQKELLRQQKRIGQNQLQTYQQAVPAYQEALQGYQNLAGFGQPNSYQAPGFQGAGGPLAQSGPGTVSAHGQTYGAWGSRRQMPGFQAPAGAGAGGSGYPGGNYGFGGNYGTPEDALRNQQAEEDINRFTTQQGNQLGFNLRQRGIADASIGAALARNQQQGAQQYGQFRRQMAINAPHEMAQRYSMLTNALNPALSMGGQAAQIFGQQGNIYGNQASQAFGNIGNIAQQLAYQHALSTYGMGNTGGGGAYGEVNGPAYAMGDQPAPSVSPYLYGPQMPYAGPYAPGAYGG